MKNFRLPIRIKRVHEDAQIPIYATSGSACFDLYAVEDAVIDSVSKSVTISVGLIFEIPEGWQMLLFSRSGHGFKHGIRLANCVGVIDSDYRGDVRVRLTLDDIGRLEIKKGDRVAQGQLLPTFRVNFEQVSDVSDTDRGTGGFGSTD